MTITIEGQAGEGKTTVATLITKTLREAGFDVRLVDDEPALDELSIRQVEKVARSSSLTVETRQRAKS